jgi:hypothetical protein
MKIENLIEKDKQKQVNPFAFTRLEARLNEKSKANNFVLLHSLQILSLLLVFAFSFNSFYLTNKEEKVSLQQESFEQFAEENCFDILVNYYPTILFE